MKVPFSDYLTSIEPGLQALTDRLSKKYDYTSLLAADSPGLNITVSRTRREVSSATLASERGMVVRTAKNGQYSEYSFNRFDPDHVDEAFEKICAALDEQQELLTMTGSDVYKTAVPEDKSQEISAMFDTEQLPENADVKDIVARFTKADEEALASGHHLIECIIRAQSTHVSKLFLTKNKCLKQSYVYSEMTIIPVACRPEDGRNVMAYEGISDQCGPELFADPEALMKKALRRTDELLTARRVKPGEYEIITSPEVSGLIAHEAFGHGVEMDMFVKDRALGKEYIGKRVGSDLVTMHEGALCAKDVTSYAFDDEGTPAGDVTEIDHGILKTGICDALSALRLNTKPTGNGKRENFEHKVYTRMTNTVFDSGTDTLEAMIASVKHGYLLEGMESGMEDPKHWGIQCIVSEGHEIMDGKLTGRIVSPIIMTGYVPDLLGSISMASADREVFGTGACGKGHKEWVKVSDGGPYLKMKVTLG